MCIVAGELSMIYGLFSTKKPRVEHAIVSQIDLPSGSHASREVKGPRAMIGDMQFSNMGQGYKRAWLRDARVKALLGACARTLPSVRSAVRCYIEFAGAFVLTVVTHLTICSV